MKLHRLSHDNFLNVNPMGFQVVLKLTDGALVPG